MSKYSDLRKNVRFRRKILIFRKKNLRYRDDTLKRKKKKYEFFKDFCKKKTFRIFRKKRKFETKNEILIRKNEIIVVRKKTSNSSKRIRENNENQKNSFIVWRT